MIEQKGRQTDVLRKKQREFRTGIIKQIDEKQEYRINERRAKYQEGVKLEEEAKARRQRLEEAKIMKLNELRFALLDLSSEGGWGGVGVEFIQFFCFNTHPIAQRGPFCNRQSVSPGLPGKRVCVRTRRMQERSILYTSKQCYFRFILVVRFYIFSSSFISFYFCFSFQ